MTRKKASHGEKVFDKIFKILEDNESKMDKQDSAALVTALMHMCILSRFNMQIQYWAETRDCISDWQLAELAKAQKYDILRVADDAIKSAILKMEESGGLEKLLVSEESKETH